ncbi:MAG: hypothetical protein JNM84_17210 [Planctomycetes bacterium]|nr:hypothetical protein [Planctomycetota bacterium]
MNARWLAIALALGAALVAWLVSRSGGAAESSELQRSISAADAASETVRSDELPRATTRDAAATESAAATKSDAAPNEVIAPGALRVRVLDHEGRPLAGERVFVSKRGPWERSREARKLWTATSDDAGRAQWPEAAATLAQLAGSDASTRVESGERAEGLAVFLDGYVPDLPFVAIERAEELAQEIVLRAPRTGSVELRVTTPLAQPVWFGYARLYAWSGKGDRSGRRSESDPSVQGRIEDGLVRFPRVQLGVPLRATASMESGIRGALDLAPLESSGEVRTAEIRLGEDGVTVRVRVLAEDGSSLPRSREFRVKTFRGDEWRSDRGGFTDPDSVLWIPAGTEGPAREEFRVTIDGDAKGQAEVRVKIEHARGLIDAGDVLLRRGGVALAGRVRRAAADPSQSSASASLELFVEPWSSSALDRPRANIGTDAEGRFEWRHAEAQPGRELSVLVRAQQREGNDPQPVRRSRSLRFPIGTQDAEIVLEELGTLTGLWKEALPFAPRDLQALLLPAEPERFYAPELQGAVDEKGVRFRALLAGEYALRLFLTHEPQRDVVRIDALRIVAGAACADPRLLAIDLNAQLRVLLFDLASESLAPPFRGKLALRRSGEPDARWNSVGFYGTRAETLVAPAPYDVLVLAEGARSVRLQAIEAGQRLTLEPGYSVVLTMEGTAALPANGEFTAAQLTRYENELEYSGQVRFDASGRASIVLPEAGRYALELVREVPEGSSFRSKPLDGDTRTIEVRDQAGEQRVVVSAPK